MFEFAASDSCSVKCAHLALGTITLI